MVHRSEGVTMPRLLRSLSVLAFLLFVGSTGCDPASTKKGDPPAPSSNTSAPSSSNTAAPKADESSVAPRKAVLLLRVPDGGIQPQAVEHEGIHLIYFKGEAKGGDVYYVKGRLDGEDMKWSKPLRVNSRSESVLAMGNIRGAQLAIDSKGRAHVAWVGSSTAEPKAPGGQTPMLYARLNDDGTAFEPQRNVVQQAGGVEGGSISAEGQEIKIFWHAAEPGKRGEVNRRVWMIASHDGGKTFPQKEKAISPADTGVCGCCGMRALNQNAGSPALLYRSATEGVHRDTYFLHPNSRTQEFDALKLDTWKTEMCPMSLFSLYQAPKGWLAAWETKGQVSFGLIDRAGKLVRRSEAPGKGVKRKFPVVCSNDRYLLLAWTEGMEWNKGGAVAWQLYEGTHEDKDSPCQNSPEITDCSGRVAGVPPWSLIAAVPVGDKQFVIFY